MLQKIYISNKFCFIPFLLKNPEKNKLYGFQKNIK